MKKLALLLTALLAAFVARADTVAPIPVKAVVVTMFEIGADTGDKAGEFQLWVEREKLTEILPFPSGERPLRLNRDTGVLGINTGMGTAKAASSVAALGADPRFDLTKAYWIIVGIAGVDPADASVGSAAWARWVVDGDLAHEIDAREIPAAWPDGYTPLFKAEPAPQPVPPANLADGSQVFRLNEDLLMMAYNLTKDIALPDTDTLRKSRARYTATPNAQKPPFVLIGDNLASGTFWHGAKLNQWANRWTAYQTAGAGNYVTTAMEDTGTLCALTRLATAKRIDFNRVLLLRTASNYDSPPPGLTAAENLAAENGATPDGANLSALDESVEAAWLVASPVLHKLIKGE